MTDINFKPWVGKNYFSRGYKGKRILVLGESHYCNSELTPKGRCYPLCCKEKMRADCFSQTNDVVSTFVYEYEGEKYMQTFLCFERAVSGKELSQDEREEFWQAVIFYNYLQFSLSGPRIPPQSEHWKQSETAFKEILMEYMPDYIIVWGVRLYDGLPDWGGKGSVIQIDEENKTDVWTYEIRGKHIPAMKVYHPSTPMGKSWPYWHAFYKKFLNL